MLGTLSGCTQQTAKPAITFWEPPSKSQIEQENATDGDRSYCQSAVGVHNLNLSSANACFTKNIKKLTTDKSAANEIIIATYSSCDATIADLAESSIDVTHCKMMNETGKSLSFFKKRSSLDKQSSEQKIKQIFYPQLLNEIMVLKSTENK